MNIPYNYGDYDPEHDSRQLLPCHDKLAFDTQREATGTATVAEYRYGNKLQAYRCSHCQLWHLSSASNA